MDRWSSFSKRGLRNSSITDSINHRNDSRLLIAQYSGGDSYTALLNLTSPMNQAYANMWAYDYLLVTGFLIQTELPNRNATESWATYNKVMLLERILLTEKERYQQYDKLLILDSDAMMYDFSRDIASLMEDEMLVAHKVSHNETRNYTTNINIGVTLWNLRHPEIIPIVKKWKQACLSWIRNKARIHDNDQTPLHDILKENFSERQLQELILAVTDELGYGKGQFVRHFIRSNGNDWNNTGIERRRAKIQESIDEVCERTFDAMTGPKACAEFFRGKGRTKAVPEQDPQQVAVASVNS